ncbi:MAG: DUF3488 and DUF4129 domain-containing transglutaminase family protein [Bdellovibrionaceae bacterium]|nr:DUF3488 and DUF4129 domain-containing transglutaminase family protein [Pseudobdellovibrionaceae bacterium]
MTRAPGKQLQLLLLLIVSFNVIPHTFELPPWITATSISFLLWTALHLFKNVTLPPTWLRAIFVVAGGVGVFFQWHTIVGQEPATGLLVYLASLKMLEATRYRDAMYVIFTSYFLLMAHLLTSQSLPSTLYMGLDVLLITALMFQLHKRDRRTSPRSLRPAMRLLGVALPVWIFLFLVFPRFSAGLWRLNAPPPTQTGFSDDMSPGDVEKLIQSDEPAFRATFTGGEPPSPIDLYWRGAILYSADGGLRWSRNGAEPDTDRFVRAPGLSGPRVRQEIVLEPAFKKWLFALDFPREIEFDDPLRHSQVRRRPGMIFEVSKEIGSRTIYQASSSRETPAQALSIFDRKLYLQLPSDLTTDVIELAQRLNADTDSSTRARVDRVMRFFDDEEFRYSKEPGALKTGLLREFLFESKVGFCEHFAASFATLMRLMKVPARVVVGFQGGIYNGFGRYVLVRSLDAHAWAEVWDESQSRWLRVDPTATIAPLRLRVGGDYNLVDSRDLAAGVSEEMIRNGFGRGWATRFSWRARLAWDAAAMRWNNFLLKYDFQFQQELFAKLGLGEANRWIFFLWLAAGLLLFAILLQTALRLKAKKEDPLLDGYHRFCSRCAQAGLPRLSQEGPLAYSRRLIARYPDAAIEIEQLMREFITLRYGRTTQADPTTTTTRRARAFQQKSRRFMLPKEPTN